MSKIISIEGLDCSFKETTAKALQYYLKHDHEPNLESDLLSFPNYDSESSYFVKNYLEGNYGTKEEINKYEASLFYALDRYDTLKKYNATIENKKDIIIFDRYVGSNLLYQTAKCENITKIIETITWIKNLEYRKLNSPEPDITIFLRVPLEISLKLLKERKETDILEQDIKFQEKVYNNANYVCHLERWDVIECIEDEKILSTDIIVKKIVNKLKEKNII